MRKNLIRARELRGWSRTEAARQIGVSDRSYMYYERGERNPTLQTAERLERVFKTPISELLVRSDSTPDEEEIKIFSSAL